MNLTYRRSLPRVGAREGFWSLYRRFVLKLPITGDPDCHACHGTGVFQLGRCPVCIEQLTSLPDD